MGRFEKERLTDSDIAKLKELNKLCKGDILTMTTLAKSGHPGGSMSSLDIYLTVYSYANVAPDRVDDPSRDKIVVSHGHTSPGVFSVLGRLGFFDVDEAVATFRYSGSMFEGHVVRSVPGVEWSSGNLGQGLSAGCGFALGDRLHNRDTHIFVLMSDGESTKGQVAEARRFAAKYGIKNITVVVDNNNIQISGKTCDIMPCRICDNYRADGWETLEVDGHDFAEIYGALRKAIATDSPVCIIANTVIGKGVSFMENDYRYHGKTLDEQSYAKAMSEVGLPPELEKYKKLREKKVTCKERKFHFAPSLEKGAPVVYGKDEKTDNRSAYGKALYELAKANAGNKEFPFAVFDCDLATSVKTDTFAKEFPENFFQVGVQEHNAATIAGAISTDRIISFFSDFAVFGIDETYNQSRLNDLNHTNLKLVCTHVGLDVGEDGKTHQCIDYIGTIRNLFGFRIIIPADPNQTDRVIRYVAGEPGNWFVGMGRSKTLTVETEKGDGVYFDEKYKFEYGKADILCEGKSGYIITMGCLVPRALKAVELLKAEGISIGIINMSCPLEIDGKVLDKAIATGLILTMEDHHIDTGLGMTVGRYLLEKKYAGKFLRRGVTRYGSSGEPEYLFKQEGMDPASVAALLKSQL
ncbi:MAG: transketolase [Candidatus Omnitrophica bacterium]|nr:transketolase [Candidatus Omnitrophota bacterium]